MQARPPRAFPLFNIFRAFKGKVTDGSCGFYFFFSLFRLMKAKDDKIKELEAEGKKNEKLVEELKSQHNAFKNTIREDLKSVILTGFKKKEFQFFLGESLSDEAMLILMTWPEDDPEGRPLMYFIKYGLKEVKVVSTVCCSSLFFYVT